MAVAELPTKRLLLVDASSSDDTGSMGRYADLVERAAARGFEGSVERLRVGPGPYRMRRIVDALAGGRRGGQRGETLVHVLDGSRALPAAALLPSRTVVTVHDLIPALQAHGRFPVAPPGPRARIYIAANLRVLSRAARLCAVSHNSSSDLARLIGRAADAVIPLPLAFDPLAVNEDGRDERLVMHVGNNGFYKNRPGVLRIFAEMRRQLPALQLLMLGPEPDADLRSLVSELSLEEAVTFEVDPGDEALRAAYARAGLLLFPSLYEGYGWPPLEAMAAGCPVAVSNRGSLPEVAEDAAVVEDPDDVPGFARAACRMLGEERFRSQLVARGRERVERLDTTSFADALGDLYASAFERASMAPVRVKARP